MTSTVDPLTVHGDELADVCAALGISYAGAWSIRNAASVRCTYSWDPARRGYVLSRVGLPDAFLPHDFAETPPLALASTPPSVPSSVCEVAPPAPTASDQQEHPHTPVGAPKRRSSAQPRPATPATARATPAQGDLFALLGGSR